MEPNSGASERRAQLAEMLDSTVKCFKNVLVESTDLYKLTRHSGMRLDKSEVAEIQERLATTACRKIHERTGEMIRENQICERFDELDEWQKRCEVENARLARPNGYRHIKPKRDIGLHLYESHHSLMSRVDAEIALLEASVEAESRELAHRRAVAAELAAVVESQQTELWPEPKEQHGGGEHEEQVVEQKEGL